ncbi:uncharacterized protein LOC115629187 [Scaptodrosophila lebanonensis]|uniref:Uncharacterized protein LOC115629187 n=1 Tax=Drosophila lebanonensis TaxID=7225 RepID=A0A6J2U2T3_DROLE|nr:uncharacterized protein LOC115629187 [Scaptodrosophila lebanonensis]
MSTDEIQDGGGTEETPTTDQELDVGSDRFNPLRALYDRDYKITEKTPKVFYQNVAAFESALKKFGIWELNKQQKRGPGATGTTSTSSTLEQAVPERRFEPHQMAIHVTAKKKNYRNLYTHMAGTEGPLAALRQCLPAVAETERQRVRIVVRKEHSISGSIEGELIAFDKQWNVLMNNAVEIWKRRKFKYGKQNICGSQEDCSARLNQLGVTLPSVQVKSLNRKNVELRRELPQLLVRGENVVLIQLIGK